MGRASAWRFYVPPESMIKGVLVNRRGERLCNEDLYGATIGEYVAANGGDAYLIFDSATRKEAIGQLREQCAYWQLPTTLYMLFAGYKKASSSGELAAKAGLDSVGLEKTMAEDHAQASSAQADPMGKSARFFRPQAKPPFYPRNCAFDAAAGFPCASMTLGGLVVDEATGAVVQADGSAIPGLYAAGRNAVGICSKKYGSGLSIADCVFSGRRAGRYTAHLESA
jgi:3-oxo-5alpha-steroid 4-dehydrogenase